MSGSGVRRPALFIHLLQGQTQHRALCPSQAVLGSLLKGFQTSQCLPKNPGQRGQALLFLICLAIPHSGGKDWASSTQYPVQGLLNRVHEPSGPRQFHSPGTNRHHCRVGEQGPGKRPGPDWEFSEDTAIPVLGIPRRTEQFLLFTKKCILNDHSSIM